MSLVNFLLLLSVSSNVIANVTYIVSVFRNKIKPHAFTFLVWVLVLSINFVTQFFSGVGWSTLLLASNILGCSIILIVSLKKGNQSYDTIDLICLSLGIFSIILWITTKTPLYSVVLSCLIDVFAFIPSFRKSFYKPNEDSSLTFLVSGFEYVFSFPAYKVFSFLVLAYPITVTTLDFAYAFLITFQRLRLRRVKTN